MRKLTLSILFAGGLLHGNTQVYITAGTNGTVMATSLAQEQDNSYWGVGWRAGIQAELPLNKNIYFATGTFYEINTNERHYNCCFFPWDEQFVHPYYRTTLRTTAITVPAGFGWKKTFPNKTVIKARAGAYISMMTGAHETGTVTDQYTGTRQYQGDAVYDGKGYDRMNRLNWGLAGGLGTQWKLFGVELNYQHALSFLAPENEGGRQVRHRGKFRSVSLNISYQLFSLKKRHKN